MSAIRSLMITGAGGYVGRRFLELVPPDRFSRLVCLVRRAGAVEAREGLEVMVGDLLEPAGWQGTLEGCDGVLHLAAVTGKARRKVYFRVNVEGTEAVLAACAAAGVGRMIHVSSIAAGFADQTRYHYAHAKLEAEARVKAAGIDHAILRPTIIVGPDAPVLTGLAKLACAPFTPVFGRGSNPVQPIYVDDLVRVILALCERDRLGDEVIEVGGPDVLTIEDLLARLRKVGKEKGPRAVHLPLRPIRGLLGLLEGPLLPVLPLTAGQLASFANDGTTRPHELVEGLRPSMKPLDDVLTEAFGG